MRVTTANLDFVRGGDRRYLAHLCETADVVCVQEAKDVDLAAIVPAGWAALQDFEGGPDRAGSGICYRTATVDMDGFTLVLGARPQPGVKMLTRWIALADATEKATGRKARVFAAHAPKRDTGLQPLYYRRLKAAVAASPLHVVVGGDFNRPHDAVATLLGLHGVGEGIIGVLADKRIRFGTVRVDDTGMRNGWTDHPSVAVPLGLPKEIVVTIPDPYAHSTFHGKPLDNATIAALKIAEERLGYELTILQGIGGAAASAGTHTEGRAVDLAPWDAERKLKVLKDLGFAVWLRPELPGVWGPHIHGILIFESRSNSRGLADVGFRQIAAFDAGRDGLKSNRVDNSYRPSPRAVFTRAEYEATFSTAAKPPPVVAPTPEWDALWEYSNHAAHAASGLMADFPADSPRGIAAKKARDLSRQARTLASEFSTKH